MDLKLRYASTSGQQTQASGAIWILAPVPICQLVYVINYIFIYLQLIFTINLSHNIYVSFEILINIYINLTVSGSGSFTRFWVYIN